MSRDLNNVSPMCRHEAICQAMMTPEFYPHPVNDLECRETHISSVFLTGRWAYKLKKPVDFGFLDFRDPAARHRFCEQEVCLNQRLSKDVYIGVKNVYQDDQGRFSLQGRGGRVADWVVQMRQLPDSASLKELSRKKQIDRSHMFQLGQRLVDFYANSERSARIDRFGRWETIAFNMEENFRQLEPFREFIPEIQKWEFICQVSRSYLDSQRKLFDHRVKTGCICDGHGDLRTDHIYFFDGLQIIDCIEFNDRLRYGDIAADLAFLKMDLDARGHAELSRILLTAYMVKAHDPGIYAIIDFYAAYRSAVRLKVACFQLPESDRRTAKRLKAEVQGFLDQAYRYAIQFSRPTIWVICGLPASGKSTLAERLADAFFLPLFQSDRLRKPQGSNLQGEVVAFGTGRYSSYNRRRIYARLLDNAQERLKCGQSVILDATFSDHKWRNAVRQLAIDTDVNIVFIECSCKEKTLRKRLSQREATASISDARLQHLRQMTNTYASFSRYQPDYYIRINTDRHPDEAFFQLVSKGYACQSLQIETLFGSSCQQFR